MQCRREPAERGSAVEEAAMSATVIPLLMYDKLYPLGDLPERRERSYGSRTPPLYSLSCANRRLLCTLTEPPRRGAELSLGPCACCLRWRNHPSSPWEVGGKKPPGDGSTTLALLHFMRPIHFLPGCMSSATCSASARVRLPCSCVTAPCVWTLSA